MKASAPANKASDLNTAVSWLLQADIETLPATLKPRAEELRSAFDAGEVNELHIWFVHNLPESKNVQQEIRVAEKSAKSHLPAGRHISVFGAELGATEMAQIRRGRERSQ